MLVYVKGIMGFTKRCPRPEQFREIDHDFRLDTSPEIFKTLLQCLPRSLLPEEWQSVLSKEGPKPKASQCSQPIRSERTQKDKSPQTRSNEIAKIIELAGSSASSSHLVTEEQYQQDNIAEGKDAIKSRPARSAGLRSKPHATSQTKSASGTVSSSLSDSEDGVEVSKQATMTNPFQSKALQNISVFMDAEEESPSSAPRRRLQSKKAKMRLTAVESQTIPSSVTLRRSRGKVNENQCRDVSDGGLTKQPPAGEEIHKAVRFFTDHDVPSANATPSKGKQLQSLRSALSHSKEAMPDDVSSSLSDLTHHTDRTTEELRRSRRIRHENVGQSDEAEASTKKLKRRKGGLTRRKRPAESGSDLEPERGMRGLSGVESVGSRFGTLLSTDWTAGPTIDNKHDGSKHHPSLASKRMRLADVSNLLPGTSKADDFRASLRSFVTVQPNESVEKPKFRKTPFPSLSRKAIAARRAEMENMVSVRSNGSPLPFALKSGSNLGGSGRFEAVNPLDTFSSSSESGSDKDESDSDTFSESVIQGGSRL